MSLLWLKPRQETRWSVHIAAQYWADGFSEVFRILLIVPNLKHDLAIWLSYLMWLPLSSQEVRILIFHFWPLQTALLMTVATNHRCFAGGNNIRSQAAW